jgi:hypothetical protein
MCYNKAKTRERKVFYMPIVVKPSGKKELTKISCCACGEKLRGVGLEKDSIVYGLNVKCTKCGKFNEISAEKPSPI